jgi:hypothetical protein
MMAGIQIVTTGPDWPAIAAAISTGVVGLAGIGGTLWQGKRAREHASTDLTTGLEATTDDLKLSIKAENSRARLMEKRRVYAHFTGMLDAAYALVTGEMFYPDTATVLKSEDIIRARHEAMIAAHNGFSELQLIAPAEVRSAALVTIKILTERGIKPDVWNSRRKNLRERMRTDLGEPVEPER